MLFAWKINIKECYLLVTAGTQGFPLNLELPPYPPACQVRPAFRECIVSLEFHLINKSINKFSNQARNENEEIKFNNLETFQKDEKCKQICKFYQLSLILFSSPFLTKFASFLYPYGQPLLLRIRFQEYFYWNKKMTSSFTKHA